MREGEVCFFIILICQSATIILVAFLAQNIMTWKALTSGVTILKTSNFRSPTFRFLENLSDKCTD
jgi:hypothetical protein